MKEYKVKINKAKCLGCGTCAALMPEVFKIGPDNKSEVKLNHQRSPEEILMVSKSCPTGAVEIYDEQDKKVWPK
ncbi:MAG TPA: ferredoxin [Patescibacteria group bacterium]|nr:ferredoxin [Patescibacteria group bacterium]